MHIPASRDDDAIARMGRCGPFSEAVENKGKIVKRFLGTGHRDRGEKTFLATDVQGEHEFTLHPGGSMEML
jgi:hypothetical protein